MRSSQEGCGEGSKGGSPSDAEQIPLETSEEQAWKGGVSVSGCLAPRIRSLLNFTVRLAVGRAIETRNMTLLLICKTGLALLLNSPSGCSVDLFMEIAVGTSESVALALRIPNRIRKMNEAMNLNEGRTSPKYQYPPVI